MKNLSIIFFLLCFYAYGQAQTSTYTYDYTYTYNAAGNRTLRVVDSTLMKGARQLIPMRDTSSSSVLESVQLYPNPTTGIITIKIVTTEAKPVHISVYDLKGRMLKEESLPGNQDLIDISNFPAGEYMMKIKVEKEAKLYKIIKK